MPSLLGFHCFVLEDRSPAFLELDVPSRVRPFADDYGMTGNRRRPLVPTATRMIHRCHADMRAAAEIAPAFRRF
jgi:hypothetical protein